jgi:hypothetical protein
MKKPLLLSGFFLPRISSAAGEHIRFFAFDARRKYFQKASLTVCEHQSNLFPFQCG